MSDPREAAGATRLKRVAVASALAIVVGLLLATQAAARGRASGCRPHHHVLARHGAAVLFDGAIKGRAGPLSENVALFGCLTRRQRPVLLIAFTEFETYGRGELPPNPPPSFERLAGPDPVFAGSYVAFAYGVEDVACGRYMGGECAIGEIESFNLRTGRRRAFPGVKGPWSALVITVDGWIAWVEGSGNTLHADGSHGTVTLDPGPVKPGSLKASGRTVRWTKAGVARSLKLS